MGINVVTTAVALCKGVIQLDFFNFTKTDYEYIVKECMLDKEYSKLLEYKIKGYTRTKMAMELNVSEPTLDVMIRKLKKKIKKII